MTQPSPALRWLAVLPLSLLPACAALTAQQQAAVAKLQVITAEPAQNCQNLGPVSGSKESMGAGGMRAKAVLLGGNTVHTDASGGATAFYCPDLAEPPPNPDEPTP